MQITPVKCFASVYLPPYDACCKISVQYELLVDGGKNVFVCEESDE
jgi:hypothetical protein